MSNVNSESSAQSSVQNQNISLLTTSGTLELYVLSVGNGASWVLPKSLALEELTLEPKSLVNQQVEWQGHKIPLVILGTKADMTHALVIEGDQDHLQYAIATTSMPKASKVRISAMKDIETASETANAKTDQFVYQYVTHDGKTWIVPDLEKLEQTFKRK